MMATIHVGCECVKTSIQETCKYQRGNIKLLYIVMHYEQDIKDPRAVPKYTNIIDISIINANLDYYLDCSRAHIIRTIHNSGYVFIILLFILF